MNRVLSLTRHTSSWFFGMVLCFQFTSAQLMELDFTSEKREESSFRIHLLRSGIIGVSSLKHFDITAELLKFRYLNINENSINLEDIRKRFKRFNDEDKQIFNSACNFIGLLQETKEQWLSYKKAKTDIMEDEIKNKIDHRNKARADKDYKEADNIRDYLLDKGVLIEDKDGKTIWKFK
mgnify:CR=1 FL=1